MKERFTIVPAVYLILIRDGEVLLGRRRNTGFHDGEYMLPSGHVDGGETFREAMIREAKEEIGIVLDSKDLRLVHTMHRKSGEQERGDFFFTTERWEGEPKNIEGEKCDHLDWFPMAALPDNTIPYVRFTMDCFRRGAAYSEFSW